MENLTCEQCQKTFGSIYTKNRHITNIHQMEVEEKKSKNIRCPMCPEEKNELLKNHQTLIQHLVNEHCVSIKETNLCFGNMEEFINWKAQNNREVDYACTRVNKRPNDEKHIYYDCNRSNTAGFKSNSTVRCVKAGGSIKISGVCPSRISVKISKEGLVNVTYIETHVGHEDELRTKRLLKKEQEEIVQQLKAGVSYDRILQDSRRPSNQQLERKNLVTRGDLRYLVKKFNIDKKRHEDDMLEREEEVNFIKLLNEEEFKNYQKMFKAFKEEIEACRNNEKNKKRKIEKQS